MLYNSLAHSKLIYGLLLWGVGNIDKIFMKQKEAIRAVTISRKIAHTEPLFKKLSILKIYNMFSLRLWKFCFKLFTNELPPHFQHYLDTLQDTCQTFDFRNRIIRTPIHSHTFFEHFNVYML